MAALLVFLLAIHVPVGSAGGLLPDAQAPRTDLGRSPACADTAASRSIHEHRYVRIGGIDQWVTIDGADCANPVVLVVHGGPGNPLTPYADRLYGSWQDTLTLVHWDQRLSGRTYLRNESTAELTIERLNAAPLTIPQLVADGLEIAEYVRTRLGKSKIVLTGSSWGSVLGVHMVRERPDVFLAYVGVSQFVGYRANLTASYAAVLAEARRREHIEDLATLERLGPPPWTDPRSFGQLRRIIRRYEADAAVPGPAFEPAPAYASDSDRAAYAAGEELSFLKFVGLSDDGMAVTIDLPALGTEFDVPMFLVQGAADLLTMPDLSRRYFERISAPAKAFIAVPDAGHDTNGPLLEAQYRAIMGLALPHAERNGQSRSRD